ncbi:MAG: hypothetical protein ACKVZH_26675 [Blastocatellia bacterium]
MTADLNKSLKTVQGKAFPATIGKQGEPQKILSSGCCEPYATSTQYRTAEVSVKMPGNTKKDKCTDLTAVYASPDPCWVAFTYNFTHVSHGGNASFQQGSVPADFKYLSGGEFTQTYDSVKNFVGKINVPPWFKADLETKVENFVKSYSSYSQYINSSDQVINHYGRACGNGLADGKSSWHEGYVDVERKCVPLEIKDAAVLEKTLKNWVDQQVKMFKDAKEKFDSKKPRDQ